MSIEKRNFPQFFITAPSPCPYLPGRLERKVFTHLVTMEAKALNSQLSQGGFRRSQNIAYRPACDSCKACQSVRVPVDSFVMTRSFKRVMSKNDDITCETVTSRATSEHYSLFRDYIDTRHGDGGMADMTVLDFAAMIDESVVDTKLVEFRLGKNTIRKGELKATALIDILDDGVSMIYSFFDPSLFQRSLGTYMILSMIELAKARGLPYLYLGYWIQNSKAMAYKSRFLPQQRLTPNGWQLYVA